jgi:hypothetical protein
VGSKIDWNGAKKPLPCWQEALLYHGSRAHDPGHDQLRWNQTRTAGVMADKDAGIPGWYHDGSIAFADAPVTLLDGKNIW